MAEVKEMEEAVDEAMELIRGSDYLTTGVSRRDSILFLCHLRDRCTELAGEILGEIMKHGDSRASQFPEKMGDKANGKRD